MLNQDHWTPMSIIIIIITIENTIITITTIIRRRNIETEIECITKNIGTEIKTAVQILGLVGGQKMAAAVVEPQSIFKREGVILHQLTQTPEYLQGDVRHLPMMDLHDHCL